MVAPTTVDDHRDPAPNVKVAGTAKALTTSTPIALNPRKPLDIPPMQFLMIPRTMGMLH